LTLIFKAFSHHACGRNDEDDNDDNDTSLRVKLINIAHAMLDILALCVHFMCFLKYVIFIVLKLTTLCLEFVMLAKHKKLGWGRPYWLSVTFNVIQGQ